MHIEPVELLPFRLNSIGDFLNQEHPELHPATPQFKEYWLEQFKYIIYGKWGDDSKEGEPSKYRWMPPALYFYTNMTVIERDGPNKTRVDSPPLLRDVEWLLGYALAECEGFSGFSGDTEYTCYRPIGRLQRGEHLTEADKEFLDKAGGKFLKPNGDYKEYIPAREYMYKLHDKPLGEPYWDNECQDLLVMSSRGVGKSYGMANMAITHDFVTNGAKDLESFLDKSSKTTVVVGSFIGGKSTELLDKVEKTYEHLRKNVGSFRKGGQEEEGVLWHPTKGSLEQGNILSNKVVVQGGAGFTGAGSRIAHISYYNNPSAGVGFRARRMVYEEVGLEENFDKVHAQNEAAQRTDSRFGFTAYIGTGGEVKKSLKVQDAFENPRAYNILPFPDNYSKVDREIGVFIPVYYRNNVYKDKNGNTDIEKAFKDEMFLRKKKKAQSEIAYEGWCVSYPMLPQEMFLNNAGNPFPLTSIDDRLTHLTAGDWKKQARIGQIQYTNKDKDQATFIEDTSGSLKPIYRWRQEKNKETNNIEGAFVIYEPPVISKPSYDTATPLYITVYDSVLREGEGSSLCVVSVFKYWNPIGGDEEIQFNIVAEWVGRFKNTDKNHEQAFKLASLYNSRILYESNLNSIEKLARGTMREHMLEPTPVLALNKIPVRSKKTSRWGARVLPGMIPYLEKMLVDLVDANIIPEEEREYVGESGIQEAYEKMVSQSYSIRFLEEMKFYTRDGNYDYVSAMFLAALWVKQMQTQPPEDHEENKRSLQRTQELKQFIRRRNSSIPRVLKN